MQEDRANGVEAKTAQAMQDMKATVAQVRTVLRAQGGSGQRKARAQLERANEDLRQQNRRVVELEREIVRVKSSEEQVMPAAARAGSLGTEPVGSLAACG